MKSRKKKKTSASQKKDARKKRLRSAEVIGLLVLLFAVFTFISLVSYDAHDPSWASVASAWTRASSCSPREIRARVTHARAVTPLS